MYAEEELSIAYKYAYVITVFMWRRKILITPSLIVCILIHAIMGPALAAEEIKKETTVDLRLTEAIDLQVLVDYVARECKLNLMYAPGSLSGKLRLQTYGPLPRKSLLGILDAALASRGYAIVDMDVPDFKRIVALGEAPPRLPETLDVGDSGPLDDDLVVRMFHLSDVLPSSTVSLLSPVLSSPACLVMIDDEHRILVVADERIKVEKIKSLLDLIEKSDVGVSSRSFILANALARDVANTVTQIMQSKLAASGRNRQADNFQVIADVRTNQIIVCAPSSEIDEAAVIIAALDIDVPAESTPVKRYKLTNTTATELLATLLAVSGSTTKDPFEHHSVTDDKIISDTPPQRRSKSGIESGNISAYQNTPKLSAGTDAGKLDGKKVVLTADVNTNSIIVVGDRGVQDVYAQLIDTLDERRPQVQIEATLVSLNTTNNYSLGVEFATSGESNEGSRLITFSSFGINTVDPLQGAISPSLGSGLTAALLDTEFADVVIRAFEQDGNSRVLSSPTLLVNDNEKGRLRSLIEQPTVTTTQGEVSDQVSFNEYVEAGTTISVIPHISEGGYLQLEYMVEVNNFLDQDESFTAAGIPPPRQTDELQSRVTIPDGHTIVVGGLTRQSESDSVKQIPLLGDIPLIGGLFKSTSREQNQATLFVFLRPTILADDDFTDLRVLSEFKLRDAGLPTNEPFDEPELVIE